MFQKRTIIIMFLIVALGLAFGTFLFRSNQVEPKEKVKASSATAAITTQADWDLGSKTNIDSNSDPGSIKLNTGTTALDLNSLYIADNSRVTASIDSSNRVNAVDGNTSSVWGATMHPGESITWEMDLGSSYYVTKFRGYNAWADAGAPFGGIASIYNSGWSQAGTFTGGTQDVWKEIDVNSEISKIKVVISIGSGWGSDVYLRVGELQLISNGSAIHITAPTQIDGGANFWQWETFTDTKTTPANTSVSYRYRTSTIGSDWTGWVGSIGAVTSRTGDDSNDPTKYRYLQVEATLSNTDGVSTPTIDQYGIGYHTNQKPNAPTAMTAVVN